MKKQLSLLLMLTFVLIIGGCYQKDGDTARTLSTDTETLGEDTSQENTLSKNTLLEY